MTTERIVIKRVDTDKEAIVHCLLWLQGEVLPHDEPRPIAGDDWWIAYKDGLPVGFASMKAIPVGDGETGAYLSRSGVLSKARGRGIQKRLIRARVHYAKKQGLTFIVTDTTDNPASANSLIAEGFKMYHPERRWAFPTSNYWFKKLPR